ncbi:MAG: electron transfer flavoprotein subunit alpha/FixB family protein [Defluviitaleaceae bacterium]|nr:electron transfer flavoprotein subunit alpha/FixB family protein [Defluviitaleaceae bacterium]MCL2273881.1 electron transfer flavoprotein subunit alpha/FixB family protein [Defluviitaleaceae bacterium]
MSQSKDVLVFCEQRDGILQKVSLELLGEGRKLADTLGQNLVALLPGSGVENLCSTLIAHGADEVIHVDHPYLGDYMNEPYTKAMTAVLREGNYEIVLIGATAIGRDLAPRVAARVKTGLTADCTSLEIDGETRQLLMTRPAFGGNILATIICPEHRPQMASIRPGVMLAPVQDNTRKGIIRSFDANLKESDKNVIILETVRAAKKTKDITEAKILISGGRGTGKEGFAVLENVAQLLGGQVSASRAAVDEGFAPKDRQVGQTGKTVRPQLYMACGISGAIQHLAGMEESELIIAVNKNASAPIFDVADVGIVGDMHKILPKLITRLEAIANE